MRTDIAAIHESILMHIDSNRTGTYVERFGNVCRVPESHVWTNALIEQRWPRNSFKTVPHDFDLHVICQTDPGGRRLRSQSEVSIDPSPTCVLRSLEGVTLNLYPRVFLYLNLAPQSRTVLFSKTTSVPA